MAKIWEPQSIEVYQAWVDAISSEASDRITSWEIDFIDSIDSQLKGKRNLTERQAEILERIYTENTN